MKIYKISSLLLACALMISCESQVVSSTKSCSIMSGWLDAKTPIPEFGQYIPIDVLKNGYKINRISFVDDSEIEYYFKKLSNDAKDMQYAPSVFLISNSDISCERFTSAANLIIRDYECNKNRSCVWGFGLGSNARPANVPKTR